VNDLDTIARRAGAAARAEAAARAQHLTLAPEVARPGGVRRTVVATAGAFVAITVAVTLVAGQLGADRSVVIDPVAPDTSEDAPSDPDAAGVGQFVAVGSMQMGCSWCPATLLDDGRVLVVGQGAELYDPTMATFTPTGPPAANYIQGRAVRLTDGRVLLVSALHGVAELYEPTTETFTAVPGPFETVLVALNGPRAVERSAAPVVLPDGRVLLVGSTAAALFDPDAGELGPTVAMNEVRNLDTNATLLADGRVLVTGGPPEAELYDPATGTFIPVGPSPARDVATVLDDGRVLLIGGPAAAQLFDPATGSFTPTGSMVTDRSWHAAALLPDGRVLVIGGHGSSGDRTVARTAEIYDPTTGQFTPAPAPTGDRRAATAITLDTGDVLVLGNYPGNGGMWPATDSYTAEIFTLTGFEPPPGCCPEAPSALLFEAATEPSQWAALAGRSIHATVSSRLAARRTRPQRPSGGQPALPPRELAKVATTPCPVAATTAAVSPSRSPCRRRQLTPRT
jgi:hypothetical protein